MLILIRGHDRTEGASDIVPGIGESLREFVEYLRRLGGAIGPHVVNAPIKAIPYQFGPQSVDQGAGKPRVVAGSDPLGNGLAAVPVAGAQRKGLPGEKKERLHHRARLRGVVQIWHRVLQIATTRVIGLFFIPARIPITRHHRIAIGPLPWAAIDLHARKKRCKLMELMTLPAVGKMIVALGTLDLNAHKDPRHFGGDVGGFTHLCHDDGRLAMFGGRPRCRDHFAGDVAPRLTCVKLIGQERFQWLGHVHRAVIGAAVEDDISKILGPCACPLGVGQQTVDGCCSLGGRSI